jgi:hypothetical protein
MAVEDGVAFRVTSPEKPPRLSRSSTVCCSEPRGIACEVGLSEILKSGLETIIVNVSEWVRDPLVPATETL